MSRISERRDTLVGLLDESERWLRTVAGATLLTSVRVEEAENSAEELRRMRTRESATLITIGLLGAFSSGKSFLLSGLQGKLELLEMEDAFGVPAEQFVGLLPSAPVPTSSCPTAVVPTEGESEFDSSRNGFLQVRMTDLGQAWQEVGNSPLPAVLEAYLMENGDRVNRLREHFSGAVAEAQILISGVRLQAKLYDLPGYGSPNATHDLIIRKAMQEIDCFIFVTPATRTLGEEDLTLIRGLYDQFLLSGKRKRVLWVVTAIDRDRQIDRSKMPAWQRTVDTNTEYLKENFVTESGGPDLDFIGEGFIPVSPADEARARLAFSRGDEAKGNQLLAAGRLEFLRSEIEKLVVSETGANHISQVAIRSRATMNPLLRELTSRSAEERLSIEGLRMHLQSQERLLRVLDSRIPSLVQDLEGRLNAQLERLSFNGLRERLHEVLDERIKAADIRKAAVSNQIQVAKIQALGAWLTSPTGPDTIWEGRFADFKKEAIRIVEAAVGGGSDTKEDLLGYSFDPKILDLKNTPRKKQPSLGVLQAAAAVVAVTTPVAAGAGYLAGMIAAGAVFPPAGAVAGAAALIYVGANLLNRQRTSLDLLRKEWIDMLDTEADVVRDLFVTSARLQGANAIDILQQDLVRYQAEVAENIERSKNLLRQPEQRERQALIDLLTPLCSEGRRLVDALESLAES